GTPPAPRRPARWCARTGRPGHRPGPDGPWAGPRRRGPSHPPPPLDHAQRVTRRVPRADHQIALQFPQRHRAAGAIRSAHAPAANGFTPLASARAGDQQETHPRPYRAHLAAARQHLYIDTEPNAYCCIMQQVSYIQLSNNSTNRHIIVHAPGPQSEPRVSNGPLATDGEGIPSPYPAAGTTPLTAPRPAPYLATGLTTRQG